MSSFKQIEQLLNLPELKLKKAADTRWLSHDTACRHTLVKVLPALEAYLEQEASERGDVLVVGLSKVVKKYKFIEYFPRPKAEVNIHYQECNIIDIPQGRVEYLFYYIG